MDGAGEPGLSTAQYVGGAGALKTKLTLLIGVGGAGVAIAAYLGPRVASLRLANRTRATADDVASRLSAIAVDYPVSREALETVDVLVNATSIGYQDGPMGSPVSVDDLAALPADAVVYDAIYQPSETPLLQVAAARGLLARNGLGMNLDQAVIAFVKANPGALDSDAIRAAMLMA